MKFWETALKFMLTTLERAYGRPKPMYVFVIRTESPGRVRRFLRRYYPDFDEQIIREDRG